MNQDLIETKTFTPVTKEKFEEWFKTFYAKTKTKAKIEQEARLSGRDFFANMKNKTGEFEDDDKDEDIAAEEGGDALFYDADAFEENIDDIDFEQDDAGIDDI
jgi:hypothetical protein